MGIEASDAPSVQRYWAARPASPHSIQNSQKLTFGLGLWLCAAAALGVLGSARAPAGHRAMHAPPAPILPDLSLALPEAPLAQTRRLVIRAGDTLTGILQRAGLRRSEAEAAAAALSPHLDARHLKPGQDVDLTLRASATGEDQQAQRDRLLNVSIKAEENRRIEAVRSGDGFKVDEQVLALERHPVRQRGIIDESLFQAATKSGIPARIVLEMIRIFSYDVDFQRDIQRGDSFEVVYDRDFTQDGRAVKDGAILYADLILSGQRHELYRFTPGDSEETDYFDAQGRSIKRALLRTPIDGARLTSTYGMRHHPILGYSRMHRGLDFGAPLGSPIQAAGDGIVEKAGPNGHYGIYVRLRHNEDYETAYGHMSRLGEGVRVGQHVRQGQTIGYVGATGLATGPHLHYEVLVKSHQVNPASVKLPTGRTLEGHALSAFRHMENELSELRDSLPIDAQTAGAAD